MLKCRKTGRKMLDRISNLLFGFSTFSMHASNPGCGSCWAFAATAALESHIAIRTGSLFSFSMQELGTL